MKHALLCLLLGHSLGKTESGYNICPRCGAHEYYEYDGYCDTLPHRLHVLRFRVCEFFYWRVLPGLYWFYRQCPDCGKTERLLGRRMSCRHEECLPF